MRRIRECFGGSIRCIENGSELFGRDGKKEGGIGKKQKKGTDEKQENSERHHGFADGILHNMIDNER